MLQRATGADKLRSLSLNRFAKLKPGERVLDIGCGPGYILDMMPNVDYVGFDTELRYIKWAKKKYAGKGLFYCEIYTQKHVDNFAPFDVILLFGVLHHLNDQTCADLMPMLNNSLKPGGRIITLDPCFTCEQSTFSKLMAKSDRGRYVRTEQEYKKLVKPSFLNIQSEIFHNICRIATTEIIMYLTK